MKLVAFTLGIVGNILSILVLASPMPIFWSIIKKGSTESFSSFPYVCILLSNMLWLYYGILDSSGILLITIGTSGCAFQTFYLSVYLIYAANSKDRVILLKYLLVILLMYPPIVVLTMWLAHADMRIRIVGILCALNSVCMYASPLSVVRMVIISKSVEYMPFLLSLSMFLCGGVWLGYGILMKDVYIEVSNGSGFCLGFLQLLLYALYYKPNVKEGLPNRNPCLNHHERETNFPENHSITIKQNDT